MIAFEDEFAVDVPDKEAEKITTGKSSSEAEHVAQRLLRKNVGLLSFYQCKRPSIMSKRR